MTFTAIGNHGVAHPVILRIRRKLHLLGKIS